METGKRNLAKVHGVGGAIGRSQGLSERFKGVKSRYSKKASRSQDYRFRIAWRLGLHIEIDEEAARALIRMVVLTERVN